jgi:hypothetical protein
VQATVRSQVSRPSAGQASSGQPGSIAANR